MSGKDSQTYTHKDWKISFAFPKDWGLDKTSSPQGEVLCLYSFRNEGGMRPNMTLEVSEYRDTASVMQSLIDVLENTEQNFRLLKKQIEASGKKRGGILYQHEENSLSVVSQKTVLPLPNNTLLLLTASAPLSVWKQYSDRFRETISSVQALQHLHSDEVEIVFGDNAPQPLPPRPTDNPVSLQPEPPSTPKRSFEAYASRFNQRWKMCTIQDDLLQMTGDEDIAKVLWAALGCSVKNWICESAPALGGKRPVDCFSTRMGREDLKALLLLMNDDADNLLKISSKEGQPLIRPDSDPLQTVNELLRTPSERRDDIWYGEMRRAASASRFYLPDRPFANSQTGFPFCWLYTVAPSDSQLGRRSGIVELAEEAIDKGAGFLVMAPGLEPWAVTLGHTCIIREHHALYDPRNPAHRPTIINRRVVSGRTFAHPSDKTFPGPARRAAREFMKQRYQIRTPSVLVDYVARGEVEYIFLFNLLDGAFNSDEQIGTAINEILWFVPPGCSAYPVSTKDIPFEFLEL